MNPNSSLGLRLNAIFELVVKMQQKNTYRCIWDCCCDHGYLGIKILSQNLTHKVVFVDQLSHIMEQLAKKLAPYSNGKHELLTADAGELIFDSQQRHLVILAGVGGERTVEILRGIKSNNPDIQIDYIFCPSTSQNALREYLVEHEFGLISESLVCEKKRYYEILYVKAVTELDELPIVPLTCNMWDADNLDHQRYLNKINSPRGSKKPRRKAQHPR